MNEYEKGVWQKWSRDRALPSRGAPISASPGLPQAGGTSALRATRARRQGPTRPTSSYTLLPKMRTVHRFG